jgi:quinol monooxygenase YgiN
MLATAAPHAKAMTNVMPRPIGGEDRSRTFRIFDIYLDEIGRQAHLNGEIAKALFAKAEELLAQPCETEMWRPLQCPLSTQEDGNLP